MTKFEHPGLIAINQGKDFELYKLYFCKID